MKTPVAPADGPRRRPFVTRATAVRLAEMAIGAYAFLFILEWTLRFDLLDPGLWVRYQRSLIQGLWGTLGYVALIIPVSVVIGFFGGWARVSRHRIVSWPVAVFVDFFRGVPPLVLVIFAYLFGPDFLPERLYSRGLALTIAAVALAMHSAAYQVEIFRAGFQSVPRGQLEAAQALGMNHWQTMRHVILPQTFRLSLPPLGNEFATVIKDTSLLAVVGATEMFALGQEFAQQIPITGGKLVWVFAIWTTIAGIYFIMTYLVTRLLFYLEQRVHTPGLEAVSI